MSRDGRTPAAGAPSARVIASALFLIALSTYVVFSYGGIRSPDSELVFRTAEALADRHSFALDRDLQGWPGFGIARGVDGRTYAIFGPGEALLAVPAVWIGRAIDRTRWYVGRERWVPVSHYADSGLRDYLARRLPTDVEAHALRFWVTLLNALVSAAAVVVFYRLLLRLAGSPAAAGSVAFLLAFGSPLLPYSGTFFSEPLALLLALLALLFCLRRGDAEEPAVLRLELFLAGLCLGLATATHVSAILFVPFFAVLAVARSSGGRAERAAQLACHLAGLAIPLALLGGFNLVRFGGVLETGRGVGEVSASYGRFVSPLPGLAGLLWSSGKGLLWFAPVALLALAAWGKFLRAERVVAGVLLTALLARLVFIAARSDWHGGFSLGPRYMVIAMPVFLLPWTYVVRDAVRRRRPIAFAAFALLVGASVTLQLYFSIGEIFSLLHWVNFAGAAMRIDVFEGDQIYFAWMWSPLRWILEGRRGPWALQRIPLTNQALWLVATALFGALSGLWLAWMWRAGAREASR